MGDDLPLLEPLLHRRPGTVRVGGHHLSLDSVTQLTRGELFSHVERDIEHQTDRLSVEV